MRKTLLLASVVILGFGVTPANAATFWVNKTIVQIQIDARACIFFQLAGVAQSDPVVSGPWFAIPKTATNYQEMVSLLLSTKLAGKPIDLVTDGTTSCGWATVSQINLE
jgi:hypothetical protein